MRCKVGYPLTAAALLLVSGAARAEVTIPDPGTFVVDRANVIDAQYENALEGWLRELEQKTTAQVKVLTVATTDGEDWFGFVQRHAELWKLGQADPENGALIALKPKSAVESGEIRVHSGRGLEGPLPDSWCGSASR
ncbi:MAG TPA: TPM domain-containing protein, partial [Phycisphaerae bacterium]|nr:TPM domain-containing protein [Phycisphaerae bacterium]